MQRPPTAIRGPPLGRRRHRIDRLAEIPRDLPQSRRASPAARPTGRFRPAGADFRAQGAERKIRALPSVLCPGRRKEPDPAAQQTGPSGNPPKMQAHGVLHPTNRLTDRQCALDGSERGPAVPDAAKNRLPARRAAVDMAPILPRTVHPRNQLRGGGRTNGREDDPAAIPDGVRQAVPGVHSVAGQRTLPRAPPRLPERVTGRGRKGAPAMSGANTESRRRSHPPAEDPRSGAPSLDRSACREIAGLLSGVARRRGV